jgi:hypothetical protein
MSEDRRAHEKPMSMKDCLEYIRSLFTKGVHDFSKHVKLIQDA